ncbi:uncharacterized protein LOC105380109 isoform X2 [Plutella xylostella]|uniref:uncharacterized protein LOC105380109 isoform X2 n=1 Tax=Plutella xylostella TaxID=51655 RepID=UPI0005D0E1EA|nr:uncharacterized protein LOC105380109 isoform X2 [Plutella xylostella]
MTTSQTGHDCQPNYPNNLFPTSIESNLRLPVDNSMHILFTGIFNGYGVEMHSAEEFALLYHIGCFGKGSASRSRPRAETNEGPSIMRKRQFLKRAYWHKKFGSARDSAQSDDFLKDVDALTSKIVSDGIKEANKDVIDLVSSEDEVPESDDDALDIPPLDQMDGQDGDMVVIVPNSDSEGENYFENFKPKVSVNRVKLQEKLMLTLQEAFFLVYGLGCLQVVDSESKFLNVDQCWSLFCETDKHFVPKYVAYHYFRSKGYIVKPGLKFGGDYLLYKEGPGITHADYIVVIKNIAEKDVNNWTSTLGHVRMASTTVKEILIVEIIQKKNMKDLKMPEGLCDYSVRELLLTRNIPVTINNDIDQ